VGVKVGYACFRDCQIFLLRGGFHIDGQGRVIETCCLYQIKNEEWIGLCGNDTIIVIMEEGEQRGICRKRTLEAQKKLRDEWSKSKSGARCLIM
jgi:hypothetical protein